MQIFGITGERPYILNDLFYVLFQRHKKLRAKNDIILKVIFGRTLIHNRVTVKETPCFIKKPTTSLHIVETSRVDLLSEGQ